MELLCPDAVATLFNAFDMTVAPKLLFYSYIPIAILSALLGVVILINERFSRQSVSLGGIILSFILWTVSILFQWTAVRVDVVHFSWQILAIFELLIFIFSFSFIYTSLAKKRLPLLLQAGMAGFMIVIAFLLPSTLNIETFDFSNCEGVVGPLWLFLYTVEALSVVAIGVYGVRNYLKTKSKQTLVLTLAVVAFLSIFIASNVVGELTRQYEFNLYGPIGMVIFFALLTYSILRYKTFNFKIFSAYIFTFAIWILVLSLLFINDIGYIHVIVPFTFLFLVYLGIQLLRTVRKEVQQREVLESLTDDLEESNEKLKALDKLKTDFLSFASHQLRTPLTAIKGYSSMLLDGSFGALGEEQTDATKRIFESTNHMVKLVEDFLSASKIEQGGLVYAMEKFDMNELVLDLVTDMKIAAEGKGVALSFDKQVREDTSIVTGDKEKLRQVVSNMIDNAIKYSPKGSVHVTISHGKDGVEVAVADNGIGMSPETVAKLFEKFSRGEAAKIDKSGYGLGLYLAQQIATAHKGHIAATSPGVGKGSVFTLVLPVDTR